MIRAGVLAALSFGVLAARGSAQREARPLIGVAATAVASDPAFAGIGPTLVFPLSSELGVMATAVGGWRGGGSSFAGRGELALQVRIPGRPGALTQWYGLGGVAGVTGRSGGGFLLLGIGAERGRVGRWWGEAGLGGGVRLAAGYRRPIRRPVVAARSGARFYSGVTKVRSRFGATDR